MFHIPNLLFSNLTAAHNLSKPHPLNLSTTPHSRLLRLSNLSPRNNQVTIFILHGQLWTQANPPLLIRPKPSNLPLSSSQFMPHIPKPERQLPNLPLLLHHSLTTHQVPTK
jgi:hypothetical protein